MQVSCVLAVTHVVPTGLIGYEKKNYLELTYITFDLMQPLPPPENQQMLLFDCPHRTHKPHGREICQQFCPVSVQWFHQ